MTYAETLNYLYHKLPMFSRMGSAAFKEDLTNSLILCKHLGDPQKKFKSIHVGGTNGKGSVSHMLAAVFQASGYKTGLYTSPHLYDFRERIKLNGEMVPEDFVIEFVENVKPIIEKIEPSFFEITVAMAFEYFAEQKVDIAIIEVGLGGRLDSTNIITPELSVITNIGRDHMNMLGDTLEKIAFEKAGIIKEKIPVVIGETLPQTKPVFEKTAKEKKASLFYAEKFFQEESFDINQTALTVTYKQKDGHTQKVESDLNGIYQVKNIKTILTALSVLEAVGWKFTNTNEALKNVKSLTGLSGRWDILRHSPSLVLEVAHNKDGIEQMLLHLQQLAFAKLHIVVGFVKDKDVDEILKLMPATASYYFTAAHIPRALPATELQRKAKEHLLTGEVFEDVNLAISTALNKAGQQDYIIVCGSIFLIAEVDKERWVI